MSDLDPVVVTHMRRGTHIMVSPPCILEKQHINQWTYTHVSTHQCASTCTRGSTYAPASKHEVCMDVGVYMGMDVYMDMDMYMDVGM